jgi:hypothetical protein
MLQFIIKKYIPKYIPKNKIPIYENVPYHLTITLDELIKHYDKHYDKDKIHKIKKYNIVK